MNNLKERLRNGEVLFGTWVRIPHPSIIEALGTCDLDFIHIDMEHGPIGTHDVNPLLLAAMAVGIPAMVRVPGVDAAVIGRTLDMGACGVIVPQVNTVEEVKRVIEAARFYPLGHRGLGGACRADGYGKYGMAEFSAMANDHTLLAVQIESKQAVDHLDEILEVSKDAVDLFFIGPADLSQSLGIPGQFTHPLLQETIEKVIRKVCAKGKIAGIHVADPQQAKQYRAMGVRYVSCSFDIGLLIAGAKTLLREFG
jgi:2-keto-3-deoxy-L-rhamnonate aldolase RhmA